ncbi:carboxylesterase/lipase family protein [Nocardia iowensis]|uniref:Carboxylic ester hydrolase n=2 Tax=Nocardia iowensis TaxID=204891 RepID=A0ABX8RTT5_NOCIO|nr:carboxylesterase family protein [Nocardia iowensis]
MNADCSGSEREANWRTKARRGAFRAVLVSAVMAAVFSAVTACGDEKDQQPTDAAVVQTRSGPVRGTVTADERAFSGIPYAAPPVGELRWKPPAAPAVWSAERDATKPGAECLQPEDAGRLTGSEDCLFLNVWTPSGAADRKRPVLVWIHGGAFTTGSGSLYNPARLVRTGDMVVVTINYRLGALGFLGHPAVAHEDGQVGNFGLLDQQAALRWVRDNIAAFGGDPAKVTIAGESAGAMSVCDHLVSPASDRLFHGAILQSGPCEMQTDRQTAVAKSEEYSATIGCPDADAAAVARCLRAVPAEQVAATPLHFTGEAGVGLPSPSYGQPLLPDDPMVAFRDGKAAKVPVLIGVNRDEYTYFVAGQTITAQQYPDLLKMFGPQADAVTAQYPLDRYAQPELAWSAVMTDHVFACPIADNTKSLTRTGPVYAYEFADPDAAPLPGLPSPPPFPLGAAHGFELPYLFDLDRTPSPATSAQQALSDKMIRYWSAFVHTGDPNANGLPHWPRHTGDQSLVLHPDTATTTNIHETHHCALWTQIPTP